MGTLAGNPSALTSERRDGAVREKAPHLKRSEEGQGRGVGTRCTTGRSSETTHTQLEFFQLFEEEPSGSRPPCLEPREPQERVQLRTVEQLADVVPMVQILGDQLVASLLHLDSRAGYRSAQDLVVIPSFSQGAQGAADGGAAGGSADRHVFFPRSSS